MAENEAASTVEGLCEQGERLAFERSVRNPGRGCFLLVWFVGWSFGCVFMITQLVTAPTLTLGVTVVPFLVAFVLIGLLLPVALGTEVVRPWSRIEWDLEPGRISRRVRVLGVARERDIETPGGYRVRPVCTAQAKPPQEPCVARSVQRMAGDLEQWTLRLDGRDDEEVVTFHGLERAEARWLAHRLSAWRPAWFDRGAFDGRAKDR